MRRIFQRPRSLYPIRSCHFCCVESRIIPPHPQKDGDSNNVKFQNSISSSSTGSQISTGSVSNWYCSSCQCWNRSDPQQIGGIATWEQKMSNEQQNVDNLQKRAILPFSSSTTSNSSVLSASSRFPKVSSFCHSCQTNQTLILSILANGDADEMDQEAMHEWQASLQARYPPVCDQCRVMVENRIETADKMARRLIWNGWLRRSREALPRREEAKKGFTLDGARVDTMKSLGGAVWILQCIAFTSGFLISVLVALRKQAEIQLREQVILLAALLASHQLALSWNPLYPRQLQLRRRLAPGTAIKVQGQKRWKIVQYILLALRLIYLLCPSTLLAQTGLSLYWTKYYIPESSLLFQVALMYYAFASLCIIEPHSISLKSRRRSSLGQPTKSSKSASNGDPAMDLLSLDSKMQPRGQDERDVDTLLSCGKPPMTTEEEMDWSPTLDSNDSRLGATHFQLGPQRFFEPVQKTGLEELLHMQLALGGEDKATKGKVNAEKRKMSHGALVAACVSAATALLAAIVAIKLGPVQVKGALDQLIAHYYPGQLSHMNVTNV